MVVGPEGNFLRVGTVASPRLVPRVDDLAGIVVPRDVAAGGLALRDQRSEIRLQSTVRKIRLQLAETTS